MSTTTSSHNLVHLQVIPTMILSTKFYVTKFNVFLFLIFISNVLEITSSTENQGVKCIDGEREALLKFKARLVDDYGRLSTWGSEEHKKECCKWTGIKCDNQTNHVVSLDLQGPFAVEYSLQGHRPYAYFSASKPLRGKISSSLSQLVDISYLDLSFNDFNASTIPIFIGSFPKLQHLNLSYSNFTGSIPPQLGNMSTLQVLDLRAYSYGLYVRNHFYGLYAKDIDWLSGLHSLQHLDLTNVNLENVTTLLKPINKLTQLKKLYMQHCRLQETIVTSSSPPIRNESALMVIDLSFNYVNISTFLWFLNFSSHYISIDFYFTHLRGQIPDALTKLTSLSRLDLSGCSFEGSIPDTIGNMISLAYLDLSGNNLEGGFPHSLGNLSELVSLKMRGNILETDLTYMNEFLMKSSMLEYLDLSDNKFYGSIPPLSRFSFLNILNLQGNQLNGSFTDRKLRLPHLTSLDVAHNRLTGRLPDLASCSSLESLSLSENKFNGTLTESIRYLSNLQTLDLQSNELEGVVSETHLFNLSTLESLDLSFNPLLTIRISSDWNPPFQLDFLNLANCNMGPSFPKWLRKQTRMISLDISNSQIYDVVPGWFWNYSHMLDYLNMSFNHIHGVIPNDVLSFNHIHGVIPNDVLSNHSLGLGLRYKSLDLRSNEFNGPLPLLSPGMTDVDLSRNKFSGEITDFCNSTFGLRVLDLSDNRLSGELSKECFTNLLTVGYLNLGSNNFSGHLPSPNSSFCSLIWLHLRNNSFRGQLPMSLGDCHFLRNLDIGNNYFTGKIPTWMGESLSQVVVLSLRSNKFTGTLPSNLCLLKNIQILDISGNDISGTIPRCLNNFTSMSMIPTSLNYSKHFNEALNLSLYDSAYIMWKGHDTEYANTLWMVKAIDLSSNGLVGEIPNEITSLRGLIALNLSRNHLVGTIPQDIDKLEYLNFLDLSENNLSGSIPTTLSELDHLGVMNLSFNNLSGKIPQSTHSETFGSNAYLGNPQLCGPPLSKPCPEDQTPQIPKKAAHSKDHLEQEDTYITQGFFVSMAIGFILAFWGTFGILTFNKSCGIKFSKLLMVVGDWWYVKIELNKRRAMQMCVIFLF